MQPTRPQRKPYLVTFAAAGATHTTMSTTITDMLTKKAHVNVEGSSVVIQLGRDGKLTMPLAFAAALTRELERATR